MRERERERKEGEGERERERLREREREREKACVRAGGRAGVSKCESQKGTASKT